MARVFFLAFDSAGQTPLVKKLRLAGHKLAISEPKYPAFHELLKQQRPPPEVFVADCSIRPSQARETCAYIAGLKAFQSTPIVLYNVRADDEAGLRSALPRATIRKDDRVERALDELGLAPSKAAST